MTQAIDGSTTRTFAAGALFVLLSGLGLLALWHSESRHLGMTTPGDPGPFFLIRLCLWAIGIAGVIIVVLAVLRRERTAPGTRPGTALILTLRRRGQAWGLAGALVVSLVLMPAAMSGLGTTVAVAIFSTLWIAILLYLRDGARPRVALSALGFGLGSAVFIHIVFVRLLSLPLPS